MEGGRGGRQPVIFGRDVHLSRGRDTVGTRTTPIQEDYLASKNVKLGLLKKGDVALYNQQVLHCGSANESTDRVRRQFYISVRDPTVKGVAARPSIRPALRGKLTLGQVRGELRERLSLHEQVGERGGPRHAAAVHELQRKRRERVLLAS